MSILLSNKVLEAAEQKIESQLTPENHANYMKIVVSGMSVALEKGPDGILASLHNSKDPLHDCVYGAINLCLLMKHQSRGTMPMKAMVPAAMTLMLKALDYADKTGILPVDNDTLVQATKMFTDAVLKKFGINKNMIHTAAIKVHGMMQDPVSMDKIKRAAGVVKDPRASEPTTLPEDANGGA